MSIRVHHKVMKAEYGSRFLESSTANLEHLIRI